MTFLNRFSRDESGATAIEYGLLIGLIALVVVGGLSAVSSGNHGKYNALSAAVSNAM